MESLAQVFGKRVRELRQARNWTQEDLATASRLGSKHIGVIERGEKTSSFEAVEKIAKALDVEFYKLFIPVEQRTKAIENDVADLLREPRHIDTAAVAEFLKGLRMLIRKFDKRAKR